MRLAAALAFERAGNNNAARIAMTTITTSNSIKVKAVRTGRPATRADVRGLAVIFKCECNTLECLLEVWDCGSSTPLKPLLMRCRRGQKTVRDFELGRDSVL